VKILGFPLLLPNREQTLLIFSVPRLDFNRKGNAIQPSPQLTDRQVNGFIAASKALVSHASVWLPPEDLLFEGKPRTDKSKGRKKDAHSNPNYR
jgi:hypothetical protein